MISVDGRVLVWPLWAEIAVVVLGTAGLVFWIYVGITTMQDRKKERR